MGKKKALITGITGQDGSYLAELLLKKGYEVHGILRSIEKKGLLESKEPILHECDLIDEAGLRKIIGKVVPDEIYNLGGVSSVGESIKNPEYTKEVVALGPARILESIRRAGLNTKFFQASSAEIFGNAEFAPQNELTPLSPQNPYGEAKASAHRTVARYRDMYGLFAANGILYNHESERGNRGVIRKITSGVAHILAGKSDTILLRNLDAKRDFGYAPEYVEAMWKMLEGDRPEDFVIATGAVHSVREAVEESFRLAKIPNWEKHIGADPNFQHPKEKGELRGDTSKAKKLLGWEARTEWRDLIRIMLRADCEAIGIALPF